MAKGRSRQKKKMKSNKGNRHSIAERHKMGISKTAIAKAKLAEKKAAQGK